MMVCKNCKQEKHESEFTHSQTGIYKTCKLCEKLQREEYDTKGIHADLSKVAHNTSFDVQNARDFLELLGYDLEKPIYLQFKERTKEKWGVELKDKKNPL